MSDCPKRSRLRSPSSDMNSDWPMWSVSELEAAGILLVQDGNHGEYRPRREEITPDGTPHIRAADVTDAGTIDFVGAQRINDAALSRIRKGVGARGDVVLTHKGTVGRVARVPRDAPHFVCSPQTTFWRSLDSDRLDQAFLFAYLRSPGFAMQLRTRMNESDMAPYVSLTAQRSFVLPLPPISEQRRIAGVTSALDNKIASNYRLRTVTDRLAAELFRASWRRDRCEETTIAHLIDARVLEIGDGFRAKNSDLSAAGMPFARARNLHDGFDFTTSDRVPDSLAVVVATKCSSLGDVVFTSKGTVGRFALVDKWVEPFVYSPQLCFWRSLDHVRLPPVVLFWWIRGREAKQQLDALKGQTDMADYVSLRDQRSMVISLPTQDTIAGLAAVLEPLAARAGVLRAESRTISIFRDALLPKLVSGQVRRLDTSETSDVVEPAAGALQAATS
jgi:type I restriction enzyme, S subunit